MAGQAGKGRKVRGGSGNKSGMGARETITSVRERIEGGMEGKKERDEIIARLVVCCHPDQIAPPCPPPAPSLSPSLCSGSADASFPL